jgi:HAD superfamily hydrolase (TIGR01509 family)
METPETPPAGTHDGGRLRGVIFDMDGVLVMSEPLLAQAAGQMFAEKGYEVRHEDFRPFIGMGEDRYLGGAAEARGIPIDPERDKARTYALYLDIIKGRLKPLPGVVDFVAECRRRGLKTAVASSADEVKVLGNLHEIGLPPSKFDVVVSGSEVARKKPAPDIFLEACRRLGLEPARCLVIEDAVSGVAAAKAAGCRCLAVTTSFTPDRLTEADWVVASLAEVPAVALAW